MVKHKISIIIPVYNEEDSIEESIKKVKDTMKGIYYEYEIIVINDGSTDNSQKILENIRDIKLIINNCNKGYGASLKKGIENARYNFILITDADSTYPIEEIHRLTEHLGNF